jgi:hypothetical protein
MLFHWFLQVEQLPTRRLARFLGRRAIKASSKMFIVLLWRNAINFGFRGDEKITRTLFHCKNYRFETEKLSHSSSCQKNRDCKVTTTELLRQSEDCFAGIELLMLIIYINRCLFL